MIDTPDTPRFPVSDATLMRMATNYLARYSASTARLRDVMARKVRRRCERRELERPEPEALAVALDRLVGKLTGLGLIDDGAYARGRAASLAARGRPAWRIRAELAGGGIDTEREDLAEVLDLDPEVQARRFAERRRLGPFRTREREAHRDRDLGAMARAGFGYGIARAVIDGEREIDMETACPDPSR